MLTDLLISLNDFDAFKHISANIDEDVDLNPWILEAQLFDLKPFLGDAFYYDLVRNPTEQKYVDLLDGIAYNYGDSSIEWQGLKVLLVYYTYARYINNKNFHDTPMGMVEKTNDFSTNAGEKTIARLVSQARAGAAVFEEDLRRFLSVYSTTYTKWRPIAQNGGKPVKITAIGGNSSKRNPNYNKFPVRCGNCFNYNCICP